MNYYPTLLLCPLALSLISLLAAMVTPPARLVISTPAGASRDRVEVADSRDKEEPAGDLTDLVAREPLAHRNNNNDVVNHVSYLLKADTAQSCQN